MEKEMFRRVTGLVIKNLVIANTGTYNSQQYRPYTTNIDQSGIEAITNLVDRSPGSISGALLATETSGFIMPTAQSLGEVGIVNGWDNQRCRFILEVEVTLNFGSTVGYWIQGFTDFDGVTQSGAISPDMVFYVNNLSSVAKTNVRTPYGTTEHSRMSDNSQVISGNTNGYGGQNHLVRPGDLFARLGVNNMIGDSQVSDVFDGRSFVTANDVFKSNRSNNVPSHYLSAVINGYVTNSRRDQFGITAGDIYERSRDYVIEDRLNTNPFFKLISTGVFLTNNFTYGDLVQIDPNVQNVTVVSLGNTGVTGVHHVGQTASWGGSDRDTVAATIIMNSVPGLMMDLFLTKIYLKATNYDVSGWMNISVIDVKSPNNGDITRNIEVFKQRLTREVLNSITFGNQDLLMLDLSVDVFGETYIGISLGGNPRMDYVAPTFADSLYSPVVSNTLESVNNLTVGFELLLGSIGEAINDTAGSFGTQLIRM